MCIQTAVKFSQTPGPSRDARVAAAMSHTGAAVAIGGVTALLGTLPLAGASSTVRMGRDPTGYSGFGAFDVHGHACCNASACCA
jgi:hypothetical protein